jgi:outer membrane protein OmpA-like peptidoglycan-associated protein
MHLNRTENTMTKRLLPSILLGCAALLLLASAAEAQVVRPHETLFIGLRGGATAYGGELDSCVGEGPGGGAGAGDCEREYLYKDLGWGIGLELGYQFTESFGFSVLGLYGQYQNLDRPGRIRTDGNIRQFIPQVESDFGCKDGDPDPNDDLVCLNERESVPQAHALFRYMPWPGGRITPFVEFGAGVGFAEERVVSGTTADDDNVAYGPTFGAGFDWLIGRQLSLFLLAEGTFWFPDVAFDGSNPGGNALPYKDEADFDNSVLYGGGLRYFFRPPYTPVEIINLDCAGASELTVGEAGTFTATINDDASEPLTFTWNWGDGTTSTGLSATHAWDSPGTYTVTFTAEGPANTATETCLVTVVAAPPALANCRVSPSRADIGETVTVSATLTGTEPFDVTVDFGDGTTADSLPASHAYDEPGTYTVTITATNASGSDTCTVTVEVGDTFCDEVTELNTVYFDFEMSSLSAEARSRLDENIEVLRRCPDICVVINGYADPQETDKLRLSERRAQEVLSYYVANGIDEDRLTARGLGEAPACNPKEDPGPGDRNCRRAESFPTDCEDLDDM